MISIHALREEGDGRRVNKSHCQRISIHALREEGDWDPWYPFTSKDRFLSTPSARRATEPLPARKRKIAYFYPRPPRGGRRIRPEPAGRHPNFYPRPPRGGRPPVFRSVWTLWNFYPRPPRGGRQTYGLKKQWFIRFLSTPSARRATSNSPMKRARHSYFYPRPPRGGRREGVVLPPRHEDFYPRPPRGGRRFPIVFSIGTSKFLSTPSARRATDRLQHDR